MDRAVDQFHDGTVDNCTVDDFAALNAQNRRATDGMTPIESSSELKRFSTT